MRNLRPRPNQSGAVLYVALIMLVLLALIGVVALQVASLQERMSANYQTSNMAFQAAESIARAQENDLERQVEEGLNPPTDIPPMDCTATFDPETHTGGAAHVRRLDLCFSWGALDVPTDEAERTDQIYQVTAHGQDRVPALASSESVIDTVFIP